MLEHRKLTIDFPYYNERPVPLGHLPFPGEELSDKQSDRFHLARLFVKRFILSANIGLLVFTIIIILSSERSAQTLKKIVSASTQPTHTITPEDVLSIRELYDVNLSPDAREIAFVVSEPNDPKNPREARAVNIWVVPAGGGDPRPLIAGLKNADSPRWSPDGRTLAFLSDRAEADVTDATNGQQVYLLHNDQKKAVRLTNAPGGVDKYEWSPDGKMIAFISRQQATPEEQVKTGVGDDAIVQSKGDSKYSRLWVVSLADGQVKKVTEKNLEILELAWSPDGDEFALIVAPTPRDEDSYNLSLVVLSRTTGEITRTLSKNVVPITGLLRWSSDGQWITFYEFPPTKESNNWVSLARARGGEIRPLLKDYRGSVLHAEWTDDSKHLVVLSVEGTKEVISSIDIETGAFHKITDVTRSQWGATLSVSRESIAYLAQTTESSDDIWLIEPNKGPHRITDFNPQTKSWRFGEVSEVVWKNSQDGLTRRGVLITPPGYERGKLYPAVINTHPGDTAWWLGFHSSRWWDWGQLLASNGYVVFLPNTRGVTGEGGTMHATIDHWGEMAFQDLMDGVDYLVTRKIADPTRLGIGGWSNGGFMTEYAITRTTRFKAAVAQAGHSDFFSLYGTSYLRDGFRRTSGTSPYYDRKWYDEHSPISLIKNCRTPTLLLHGELDQGVPVGQAREFYAGLRDAGVEAELVIYPRERHSIQEHVHRVDVQKRMLAWFNKHLK